MGIVSKQASIAAFVSYAGVIIGFINFTLLMANWFTPVQVGLREILLSVAVFSSHIGQFGTYRAMVKFYPFFKSEDSKYDNGLLRIGLTVPFIGFLLVSAGMLLFKSQIIEAYIDKSPLFIDYFWFCFPLLFLLMYNNVFESYLQARAKTAYSVFLKNVLTRLITTALLYLFYIKLINFYWFIVLFILSYAFTIFLFIIYLIYRKEFSLKLNPLYFTKRVRRVYYNYSAFSILSGTSSVLVNKMDALMIGSLLGLGFTSVYVNALYLSVLVAIPGESISRIAMPLLSQSWKQKRMDEIEELYKKTSITQFLLGGILLVLIWGSIDNFYQLQPKDYAAGKYVFLILGIAKLVNMLFGANGQIINVSKYYRFDTTTALILGVLTVLTNYIFIPKWGIEGAAIATATTIIGFNLVRFLFVYTKLKIQPFSKKTVLVFVLLLVTFGVNEIIPEIENIYVDTIYRSVILLLTIGVPAYLLRISEEINQQIDQKLKVIGINL